MGPTSLTPSPFPAPGKEPESEFLAGEKGSEASARQLKQKFCGESISEVEWQVFSSQLPTVSGRMPP
jgi:hypothetical protein